jgi:hypothetical protein
MFVALAVHRGGGWSATADDIARGDWRSRSLLLAASPRPHRLPRSGNPANKQAVEVKRLLVACSESQVVSFPVFG